MSEPIFNQPQEACNRGGGVNFRRAEDWERLTRLEFIVEDVVKVQGVHEEKIYSIGSTQAQLLSNIKTIKYTVIGGVVGFFLNEIGFEKALTFFSKLAALAV